MKGPQTSFKGRHIRSVENNTVVTTIFFLWKKIAHITHVRARLTTIRKKENEEF